VVAYSVAWGEGGAAAGGDEYVLGGDGGGWFVGIVGCDGDVVVVCGEGCAAEEGGYAGVGHVAFVYSVEADDVFVAVVFDEGPVEGDCIGVVAGETVVFHVVEGFGD